MENRLAKGRFVGLGLSLGSIECPVYLPAGEEDDITTRKQVFAVENFGGTSKKKLLLGGHIGLSMGARTLGETWPSVARWLTDAVTAR
jgi:poly(3-hydroxyalkanoate) synthetase